MNFRNPQFNEYNTIDCEIEHPEYGWIPFTADPTDPEQSGRDLHAEITTAGGIAAYVPPADITGEDAMNMVRATRDAKLVNEVDPVVTNPLRWADLTTEQQTAWAAYRTALLDITTSYPNVYYTYNVAEHDWDEMNVTWPIKP